MFFTNELEDKSVTVDESVSLSCAAVSYRYQPKLHWLLDNVTHYNCSNGTEFCVQNEFRTGLLTTSTFYFPTFNVGNASVTCVVSQEPAVSMTATVQILAKGDTTIGLKGISPYKAKIRKVNEKEI